MLAPGEVSGGCGAEAGHRVVGCPGRARVSWRPVPDLLPPDPRIVGRPPDGFERRRMTCLARGGPERSVPSGSRRRLRETTLPDGRVAGRTSCHADRLRTNCNGDDRFRIGALSARVMHCRARNVELERRHVAPSVVRRVAHDGASDDGNAQLGHTAHFLGQEGQGRLNRSCYVAFA